jgi:hypothetical protein
MKKLLFPLFALAALTFASCSKDDDKEPVGTHFYMIDPYDNSLGKADMGHMEKLFPDEQEINFSIEGTKAEADQKAIERYNDILSQIDNDAVCNAFPSYYDEGMQEYLYYAVHLTRTDGGRPDTLKSRRWTIKCVEDR